VLGKRALFYNVKKVEYNIYFNDKKNGGSA